MGFLSPPRITTMDQARAHRAWALAILIGVYVFNFIDRQVVSILQEDIRRDLGLDDFQLGLLSGLPFAIVYCTMGIPVARVADATSRKAVVAGSLALWSGFTALCGLAGNFWHLLGARLGVGLGQAGGSPPAHAMLSDLYEKEKRGRALAIYSAGIYIGTLLSYWLGGAFADAFDWRIAFILVGLPGIAFAVIVWTTVREPQRGLSGVAQTAADITFLQSFAKLWRLRSFRFYSVAAGAGLLVTYGLGTWLPSFLQRTYGEWGLPGMQRALGLCGADVADCIAMSTGEIGLLYGTVAGVGGAAGTLLGGYLADHRGGKDRRWFLWVPMWGKIIGGPLFLAAMFAPNAELSLLFYFPAIGLAAMYLGPSLAITHHLVPAGMRAMSSAVLFFIFNMIGQGLGPTAVGALSKWLGENAGLGEASLQWSMVAAVVAMYPLSILWYWGAQALPKGELDDEGRSATEEALVTGNPKATGPSV
jgi:MFS family permease